MGNNARHRSNRGSSGHPNNKTPARKPTKAQLSRGLPLGANQMAKKLPPMLHPGEVLREEFLIPLGLSAGALAKACELPRTRLERIAAESVGISADTALRLAKALNTTPDLWLNLQSDYDVEMAKRQIGKTLDRIKPVGGIRANKDVDRSV